MTEGESGDSERSGLFLSFAIHQRMLRGVGCFAKIADQSYMTGLRSARGAGAKVGGPAKKPSKQFPGQAPSQAPTVHAANAMPQPVLKTKSRKKTVILVSAVVMIVVAAVAAGILIYSNSPSRRLQQQLDLGARYLSELEYEQAISAYEAALTIDPKSTDAYIGLLAVYDRSGDTDGVRETYARAAAALPEQERARVEEETVRVLITQADEMASEGRLQEAHNVLEQSTELMQSRELQEKAQDVEAAILREREETEAKLMKQFHSIGGDGVYAFCCDDYDRNGTLEAFAIVGEPEPGAVGFYETIHGDVWYTDGVDVYPVSDHGGETYHFLYMTEFTKVMDLGEAGFYVAELQWGAASSGSEIYGVQNGQAYETIVSGYGGGARAHGNRGDFVITIDPYDAPWHAHRDYFFYYRDGEIHEYGAIMITEQQLLAKAPSAGSFLDGIRQEGYEIVSLLYRANGIVHINYQRLGATELDSEFLNMALLLEDGVVTEMSSMNTEEEWLFFEGGHYVTALFPEIAVYPEAF